MFPSFSCLLAREKERNSNELRSHNAQPANGSSVDTNYWVVKVNISPKIHPSDISFRFSRA